MMTKLGVAFLSLTSISSLAFAAGCASGEAPDVSSSEKKPMSATLTTPEEDIIPFEGAGGPTGVGGAPAEHEQVAIADHYLTDVSSSCAQSFPPPASLPCVVPEAGAIYYVSALGDDANDGTSPERPWASLFHAVKTAAPESTIKVAEGEYTSAEVYVGRALVIKGGFDSTFASWDPDRHRTFFFGKLSLAHDHAIFGGFRLVTRGQGAAASGTDTRHVLSGGTFIRNYVEVDWQANANEVGVRALDASTPDGHRTRLYCNDVYVHARGVSESPAIDVRAIHYGVTAGDARLASNRICVDRGRGVLSVAAVGGSADSSRGDPAKVTMTNNLIEANGDAARGLRPILGVSFEGGVRDLEIVATNNTIYSEVDGVAGSSLSGPNAGTIEWRLTNNVVFSKVGRDGVNVGVKGAPRARIAESSGNLVFGFVHNAMIPAPVVSANDDTSGIWTMREVIESPSFLPREDGPARRDAVNVFGDPAYGNIRTDVRASLRPIDGKWTRGAIQ